MVPGDLQWSLDAPCVLLDPPKMKLGKKQIHKTKSKNLDNLDFCKEVRRKRIDICLVEILSTSMACHLVTNRMHHIMSTLSTQEVCFGRHGT